MVGSCCISGCKKQKLDGTSFHQVPLDPKRRQTWLEFIRTARQELQWNPTVYSTLCHHHFEERYFHLTFQNRRLFRNAVPTIHDTDEDGSGTDMERTLCKPAELCVNCNALFEPGFDPVHEISVSFHKYSDSEEEDEAQDQRNISILDALSSVFNSSELIQLQKSEFPSSFSMCFRCAQTLSHLYETYIELLSFSDPAARICKLINQVELWHQKQGIFSHSEDVQAEEIEIKVELETDFEDDSQGWDYTDTLPTVEFGLSSSNFENKNNWNSDPEDRCPDVDPLGSDEDPCVRQKFDEAGSQVVRRSARITMKAAVDTQTIKRNQDSESESNLKLKTKLKKEYTETVPDSVSSETGNAKVTIDQDRDDFFPRPPKKPRRERSKPRSFLFCPEPNCSKQYYFKWRIQQHILEDHQNQKPSKCKKCGFKYFDTERFKAHNCVTREERRANNLNFRCDYCGQAFDKKTRCNQHASTHDHPVLVKCPMVGCRRRYRIPEHLEKHMKVAHKDGKVKKRERAQCQICGQFYSNSSQVKKHMETHSSEKTYVCDECGKSFSTKACLRDHIVYTHTSVRKYQCPLCNLGFKRPTHLTVHYKSKTHEDQPEKIAELLKQGNRQNVVGPVIIPTANKFKNHHLWAKGRKRTKTRTAPGTSKVGCKGEDQVSTASNSGSDPGETSPGASTSSDALNLELLRPHPQIFQVPGPSVQSHSNSTAFSTVNVPQFYGYSNYPNF